MKLKLALISMMTLQTLASQEVAIPLFPQGAPNEKVQLVEKAPTNGNLVGGETVIRMTGVSTPTITIYKPNKAIDTGTAMVVCPGGGYNILAYDLEGTEICSWLNGIGITAVLLKYRVPRREGLPKHAAPLQDVQRALRYVRANAEQIGIRPDKIGVMGFSAGAHLSAMASTAYATDNYPPFDAIDKVSSKPDFCLLVYPAYLNSEAFELAPEVKVTPETPPTLIIQAQDDHSFIGSSLAYYHALTKNKVSASMHLYSKGGHGYGLRNTGHTVNEWPERAETWFGELGVLTK